MNEEKPFVGGYELRREIEKCIVLAATLMATNTPSRQFAECLTKLNEARELADNLGAVGIQFPIAIEDPRNHR